MMGDLFGGGGITVSKPEEPTPEELRQQAKETAPKRNIAELETAESQSRSEGTSRAMRAAMRTRKRGRALLLSDQFSADTGKANLGG